MTTSYETKTNLLVDVQILPTGKRLMVIDGEAYPLNTEDAEAIAKMLMGGSKLAAAVALLRAALKEEVGNDFAYQIMGKGKVLAADNSSHGLVEVKS